MPLKDKEGPADNYRSTFWIPRDLGVAVQTKAFSRLASHGRRMTINDAIQEALSDWTNPARHEEQSRLMKRYQDPLESIAKQLDQIPEDVQHDVAVALMEVVAGIVKPLAELPREERERTLRSIVATVRINLEMHQQYSGQEDPKKKRKGS